MGLFSELFTWWNGQTLGTRLLTLRSGRLVGEDEMGNRYYNNADDTRRWVIFNGESEASSVSADWHGWLHRTFNEPPTEKPLEKKAWEKPHQPNLTGTLGAYHPKGSLLGTAHRPKVTGDYEAWSPE